MNDRDENTWSPTEPADEHVEPVKPVRPVRRAMGSDKAKIAGALIVGGVAGAAILGPLSALAASPTPPAVTSPSTGASSGSGTTSGAAAATPSEEPGEAAEVHGQGGGRNESVTDTSVVAKAIGISEADLTTALQGGQTVAAVAKAHNVNLQVVIDALVADGQAELDAAVKAGTLTQAQADAEKANLTQRATDQANGTFSGRH